MEDLDELKGRVERATRVLSEREAEEQGRHAKLVSLVAALESKTLDARRDKENAEARVTALEAENDELRGLLSGLLQAVEDGSRSRFADAIYALEARIGGSHGQHGDAPAMAEPAPPPQQPALDGSSSDAGPDGVADEEAEPGEADGPLAVEPEPRPGEDLSLAEDPAPTEHVASDEELAPDEELPPDDDFTERLAAGCAVEEELAKEAEEMRFEAVDEARVLLERIRRQVEAPDEEFERTTAAVLDSEPAAAVEAEIADDALDVGAEEAETAGDEAEALGDEQDDDGPLVEEPSEADDTLVEDSLPEESVAEGSGPDGDRPDGDTPDGDTPDGDTPDDSLSGKQADWGDKRRAAS